jgi:hypothetical protein
LIKAASISCENIQFACIKILSCQDVDEGILTINEYWAINESHGGSKHSICKIKKLGSKQAYSEFIFKEVVNYVDTDYFIIFQADGFILNWRAWTDEFYKYDYIGAPWRWYPDDMKVGNGGFSFRSKKLHLMLQDERFQLQNDFHIREYQEDHNICRIFRDYLEKQGIKYAPVELAEQFSIEAWNTPDNKYKYSFGFHGFSVDFSSAQLPYVPYLLPNPKRTIF